MRDLKHAGYLGLVVIPVLFPLAVTDNYIMHLLILAAIWIILSSGFNLLLSAGQLSLGHAAFFGIGAYTSGLLAVKLDVPFVLALPAAGLVAGLIGLLIGCITLKMRGAYFVLVTFAFAEITRLVATNWVELTEGPMALRAIPGPAIRIPGVVDLRFASYRSQYYLALALVFATIYVIWRLFHSNYGRAFAALRSAEDLAESVGISHYKFVSVAVIVSAFLAGVAGSLYAHYVTLISPEILSFGYMITILIMVIGGGRSTISGPVVGALIFTVLPEWLRVADVYRMLILGALLVVIVLFMPEGVVPHAEAALCRLVDYGRWSRRLLPREDSRDSDNFCAKG